MRRVSLGVVVLGVTTFGLSLIGATSPLEAQSVLQSRRPITIGIGGGVSVPTSNAADSLDTGFHVLGFLGLNIPGIPVGLRGTFTFNRFDLQELDLPGGPADDQSYGQVLSGLANVVLPFPTGRLTPYLMAGFGAFSIKTKRGGDDDADSETEFGINGGAGIMFPISKLNAFVEARVNNVYTEKGLIDADAIKFVPITFGISY